MSKAICKHQEKLKDRKTEKKIKTINLDNLEYSGPR